jgi:hypothetical protein
MSLKIKVTFLKGQQTLNIPNELISYSYHLIGPVVVLNYFVAAHTTQSVFDTLKPLLNCQSMQKKEQQNCKLNSIYI